jgi:phosphoribosylformylglycinamidine synthase I
LKFAILVFPGTNCDLDCADAVQRVFGASAAMVWHRETSLDGFDVVVVPGGFAYGDYLRTGAIARFSPVMAEVARLAARGNPIIGICNGFQVLTEAHLLPGALLRNRQLQFRCQWQHLRLESTRTPFTSAGRAGQVLRIPINHGEGRYWAPDDVLDELEAHDQVVLRYCGADGRVAPDDRSLNPNGSARAIAGIVSRGRNVVGLMPHPERAVEAELGSADGRLIFESVLQRALVRA